MYPLHQPTFLMCPPTHFSVQYAINPWMKGNLGRTDKQLATEQWHALANALRECGGAVETIDPDPTLPDMVFTANVAAIVGDLAIQSHFTHAERRMEATHAARWLSGRGFKLAQLPEGLDLEGTGDLLRDFQLPLTWAGYGYRTSLEAHRVAAEALQYEILTLRLVNPRFYHLDVCLAPLTHGHLMYYPGAFDAASLEAIESRVKPSHRIVVGEDDALNFACNAIPCGDAVILHRASDRLKAHLAEAGYRVVEVDLSQFMLAGGSARCLVLPLLEPRLSPSGAKWHLKEAHVRLEGHLLDFSVLARALDLVTTQGCSFDVEEFKPGRRSRDISVARLRVIAPSEQLLAETTAALGALAELQARVEVGAV
jgi:N-dimethylarginine dimethylaminohydrolase